MATLPPLKDMSHDLVLCHLVECKGMACSGCILYGINWEKLDEDEQVKIINVVLEGR